MNKKMTVIRKKNFRPFLYFGALGVLVQTLFFSDYDYHTIIFWIKIFICFTSFYYAYRLKK